MAPLFDASRLHHLAVNVRYAANWRKPRLLLRLAAAFLRSALPGLAPPLRGVDIVVTYGCNLRCAHCNISRMLRRDESPLSLEEYRALYEQCRRLGVVSFTFTGGEPLLTRTFWEILPVFRPRSHLILLQTSGALVTRDVARRLRTEGVDIVNVSLDSLSEDEHDASRGVPGTFERTMRAIADCQEVGLKVMVGTVASHANIHTTPFLDLLTFCEERGLLLLANLAVPAGRWSGDSGVVLTPDDQEWLRALARERPTLRFDFYSNFLRAGCPAFKEKIYVSPTGDVLGCTFVQVSFGNVRRDPLPEILRRGRAFPDFARDSDRCPAAESAEFRERVLARVAESPVLPLPVERLSSPGAP
ncbi:MAG: radical SAM protein [Planctomycetales bacterium]|nr:radical SAM protein [Planctomycetales bacterium]